MFIFDNEPVWLQCSLKKIDTFYICRYGTELTNWHTSPLLLIFWREIISHFHFWQIFFFLIVVLLKTYEVGVVFYDYIYGFKMLLSELSTENFGVEMCKNAYIWKWLQMVLPLKSYLYDNLKNEHFCFLSSFENVNFENTQWFICVNHFRPS